MTDNAKIQEILRSDNAIRFFQDPLKDGSEGPKMVWVAAGTFEMGDIQNHGSDDEKPVHEVSVERFAIGRYLVTMAEYYKFLEATTKTKRDDIGWGRGKYPMIVSNWENVVAYFKWLSEQTGHEYRPPTEAEWEYAARAGTDTDYWWGNDIGKKRANYWESNSKFGGQRTSPVDSFAPNPFGLYDTVGNLWEWTCSMHEEGYQGAEEYCSGKNEPGRRVVRGGSFFCGPTWARVSYRGVDRWHARSRNDGVGIRVVRT